MRIADLVYRKNAVIWMWNVSQIPKADRTLTFIRDYDGNLFEIK